MRRLSFDHSRRLVVIRGATLATGVAMGLAARRAAAKATKGEMKYQDEPHDGEKCAVCKHFTPDSSRSHEGTCAMVEGTVSTEGWCQVFARR